MEFILEIEKVWEELKKIIINSNFVNFIEIEKNISSFSSLHSSLHSSLRSKEEEKEGVLEHFYSNDIYYQKIIYIIDLILFELNEESVKKTFSSNFIKPRKNSLITIKNKLDSYEFRMIYDSKDYDASILEQFNNKYFSAKFLSLFIIEILKRSNISEVKNIVDKFKNNIFLNIAPLNLRGDIIYKHKNNIQQLGISYEMPKLISPVSSLPPHEVGKDAIIDISYPTKNNKIVVSNLNKILNLSQIKKVSGLSPKIIKELRSIYYDIYNTTNKINYVENPKNYYITSNGGNSYYKWDIQGNPLNGPKSRIFNYEKLCYEKIKDNINQEEINVSTTEFNTDLQPFSVLYKKYRDLINIRYPELSKGIYNKILKLFIVSIFKGYIDAVRSDKTSFMPDNKMLLILSNLKDFIY